MEWVAGCRAALTWCWSCCDEELAAIGVRSRVCHAEHPCPGMLQLPSQLVLELLSLQQQWQMFLVGERWNCGAELFNSVQTSFGTQMMQRS